jgi:WhiB family redox-sensing transcriptional regulator
MKTLTNHDALATKITANPAGIWPEHSDGPQGVDALTLQARINETDLPMNTFAPVDELDELDPDIPRPPSDSSSESDGAMDVASVRAPVARCADGNGTMVGLFFSDHVVDIARAKAMCALCPLEASCLADALEREEPWGVWGGQLLSGGRIIADKRPCGRPPKVPRPEVVYDEMGPVGADLISA